MNLGKTLRNCSRHYQLLLAALLLMMLAAVKLWSSDPASLLSETEITAKVISVSENSPASTDTQPRIALVTVRLESGDKARVSVQGKSPELGQQIRLRVREFKSGSRRVTAAAQL